MPDLGTLEYWQYGTVPVIVNTDNYDLGSLEYWQYGTVPVVYQQTSGGAVVIAYPDTAQIVISALDVTVNVGASVVVDVAVVWVEAKDVGATGGVLVDVDTAQVNVVANDVFATGGTTFDPDFTVLDKDGNGIAGALVEIYSLTNVLVASATTNESGVASFTGIADGTYKVVISHSQYQRYVIRMYMQSGDDFKYRLYKRRYLGITPFGVFVNLKSDDPLNMIHG